jgi:hypothetical protein
MTEINAGSHRERRRLGPYSRGLHRAAIGQIVDGRSRDGRFLRAYEAQLVLHGGGEPSAVERALIARAARLALYVELMDERSLSAGGMSDRDAAAYLAWSNALRRTLVAVGLKSAAAEPKTPTLAEIIAEDARGRAANEGTAA